MKNGSDVILFAEPTVKMAALQKWFAEMAAMEVIVELK